MPALLSTILGLLASAPADIASLQTDYAAIKGLFSTQTQAQIDAIIAALNLKVDADLSQLSADATAAQG